MEIKKDKKYAAEFNELYDYFDDNTIEEYRDYQNDKFETVDYDALDRGEIPTVEIEDEEEYLVDNYEDEELEDIQFEQKIEEPYKPPLIREDVPNFGNELQAINWAIQNNKVLVIDYTTKKGINIRRTVEPHLIFTSKSGNQIVVTYDRSVRDIRAFILNNIGNYNFTGKDFKPRMRVIPDKEKKMNKNIKNDLMGIESELKEKGMEKSAAVVKNVVNILKEVKQAQYVGVQGYWIRNRRCWDNCYRHKRTTEPNKAAQDVWFDCWDEYLKSMNDPDSGWEKYASTEKINVDKKEADKLNKYFSEKVMIKLEEGKSIPEAVYEILETKKEEDKEKILSQVENITDLAVSFNDNGFKELGIRLATISNEIMKEAGFWDTVGGIARSVLSPGETIKNWMAKKQQLVKKLRDLSKKSIDLSKRLRQQLKYRKVQSSDKKIKEAQKIENYDYKIFPFDYKIRLVEEFVKRGKDLESAVGLVFHYIPKELQNILVNELGNIVGEKSSFANIIRETKGAQSTIGTPMVPVATPTSTPASPPSVAPVSTVKQIPAQQDYRTNYIREAQNLAAEANELISWMGSNVPQDNPRVSSIVQTALYNLTDASNKINNTTLNPQGVSVLNLLSAIDNMTKAVNTAMFSIYNENESSVSKTEQPQQQTIDENKNNIDDRVEKQDDLLRRFISSIPDNKLDYVKSLIDQRLGQNI